MLTDMHTHLDRYRPEELTGVVQRAREAGVSWIVTVGMNIAACERAVQIAREFDIVRAAVGLHPWAAHEVREADFVRLRDLLADPRVVFIGEAGLDTAKTPAINWEKQSDTFRRQVRLAREAGLPLNLHVKGAAAEEALIQILREEKAGAVGGLLHGFVGSLKTAQAALELGFFISVPRLITFADQDAVRALFAQIPLAGLVLDTDSTGGQLPDGRRVEPAIIREMAAAVAKLHGTTLAAVAEQTEQNRQQLFRGR